MHGRKIADADEFDRLSSAQLNRVYDHLLHSELFRLYRDAFERLSGHSIALVKKEVAETPAQELERCGNLYCSTLMDSGVCDDRCLKHLEKLAEEATSQSRSGTCEGQITTSLIPIKVKKEVVAFIKAGQVKMDKKRCSKELIQSLSNCMPDSVARQLKITFDKMPSLSNDSYTDQLTIVGAFSIQLSEIAQKILNGAHAESLITERCKKYINDNLTEKIGLDQIADVTGVTNSYMCKQFKKYTGMTIIEYINVNRVELAKRKLNSEDEFKVVDIAYACGFQSLSQFNRSFHKYSGCSPSEYRMSG